MQFWKAEGMLFPLWDSLADFCCIISASKGVEAIGALLLRFLSCMVLLERTVVGFEKGPLLFSLSLC